MRVPALFALVIACMVVFVTPPARAQTGAAVAAVSKQILKSLGKDAIEFGGEAAAEQVAKRLLAEAIEAGGPAAAKTAEAQIIRILSRGSAFDLKSLSGRALLLLPDVSDDALGRAVGTLARAGVEQGLQSLGSQGLRRAALAGEIRLPGAGLKLVEHYGDDGAALVTRLTEDQANSVIAALRPNAINSLPPGERTKLLNALASRTDAKVVNFERTTGPLLVVAGGIVVWHGIDVGLAPNQRVIQQPDGTVIRETTSIGSQIAQSVPQAAEEMSHTAKWIGLAAVVGLSVIGCFWIWWRGRRGLGHTPAV